MYALGVSRYQNVKLFSGFWSKTIPASETIDKEHQILPWPFSCDNSSQAIPVSQSI